MAGSRTPDLNRYLAGFVSPGLKKTGTRASTVPCGGHDVPWYSNEFWTAGQRQASSIHEISYRACFKPQLPRFFIGLLTSKAVSYTHLTLPTKRIV